MYEYLFYNNLQTGEFVPWLAESYEYNDDYSALTVHLRDGVTWSDGEPFTSADIAFTYDLLRANPAMEWAAEANGAVASVDAPDPLTAVFNLTDPKPAVPPLPRGIPGGPDLGWLDHPSAAHLGGGGRSAGVQEFGPHRHRPLRARQRVAERADLRAG